jgi:hypothetical protein
MRVDFLKVHDYSVESVNFEVGTIDGSSESDAGSLDIRVENSLQNFSWKMLPCTAWNDLIEPIPKKKRFGDVERVLKENLWREKRQSTGHSPGSLSNLFVLILEKFNEKDHKLFVVEEKMPNQWFRLRIRDFKLSEIFKIISDAKSFQIAPNRAFISLGRLLIKRKEVLFSKVSVFVSVVLLVYLINFAFAQGTDFSHTSLMIFLTLSFTHQTLLTVFSEDFS